MLYDATVDDEGVIGRRRCIDDNSRVIDAPIMLMDGACFDCHFSDGRSGQAVPLESVEDEAISSLQTSIEVCRLGAEFCRLRGPQICCNSSCHNTHTIFDIEKSPSKYQNSPSSFTHIFLHILKYPEYPLKF